MRVRKQTDSGDYQFGHGLTDFWRDQIEGVAQVIRTRLLLYRGEWFLDTGEGTPWGGFPFNDLVMAQAQILGAHTQQTRDLAIKERVLGSPGVTGMVDYNSDVDTTRKFTVGAVINTIYGSSLILASDGSGLAVAPVTASWAARVRHANSQRRR